MVMVTAGVRGSSLLPSQRQLRERDVQRRGNSAHHRRRWLRGVYCLLLASDDNFITVAAYHLVRVYIYEIVSTEHNSDDCFLQGV